MSVISVIDGDSKRICVCTDIWRMER